MTASEEKTFEKVSYSRVTPLDFLEYDQKQRGQKG